MSILLNLYMQGAAIAPFTDTRAAPLAYIAGNGNMLSGALLCCLVLRSRPTFNPVSKKLNITMISMRALMQNCTSWPPRGLKANGLLPTLLIHVGHKIRACGMHPLRQVSLNLRNAIKRPQKVSLMLSTGWIKHS